MFGRDVDRRRGLVRVDAHQVVALTLPIDAALPAEDVFARPDLRPELEAREADLLGELAPDRVLGPLAFVRTAARRGPPLLSGAVAEEHEQHAVAAVEDERAHGSAVDRLDPRAEPAKPAEPLGVGDGRIRG